MKDRLRISSWSVATYLVLIAGIFLRFYHLFKIDFRHEPFRLGGLFVAFAEQIIQDGFRLPNQIPFYSVGGIPFAYPPLGFYIEAILLKLFPDSRVLIANLLPPAISALALIAALLLLRWHYREQAIYILAGVFSYAFLPSAFTNQIEAAGLAEAFGSLVLVMFFYYGIQFRSLPNWKNAALVGFALGISILSSPGSAVGATFLSGLLGLEILLKNKFSIQAIRQIIVMVLIGGFVSAPYWVTVISYHGKGIFLFPVLAQYGGTEHQSYIRTLFENLMNFSIVQDGSIFFWNLIIFLGIVWNISKGKFALPLAFLALFTVPREAVWLIALPATLLFVYGLVDVLLSLIIPPNNHWKKIGYISFFVIVGCWMAFQSFSVSDALVADKQWKITPEQIKLIENARSLIPANAKVLVLGNDALLEWSPYLLQREVINTKFGLEWKPGDLQRVTLLNKSVSEAENWDDVLKTITDFTNDQSVYVLSSDKKLLTSLNRNSRVPFKLKIETSAIQLGILGEP
jgi:hypothetical protein